MKTILGPVLGAMLVVSVPANAAPAPQPAAPADQAAKLARAHEIIAVIFPESQRESMFVKLQDTLVKQIMPKREAWMDDPGVKEIFDGFVAAAMTQQRAVMNKYLPQQMDAMAAAYSRTFSLAELKDIDAFAHTPSGAHYLSQSLALVGDPDVAKVNAAAFAEIRSVTDALVPGFKDKLIAYVKAHPDLAAEIKAEDKPQ